MSILCLSAVTKYLPLYNLSIGTAPSKTGSTDGSSKSNTSPTLLVVSPDIVIFSFTLLRFETPENMVSFKNDWKPQDAKVLKEKAKPILSGAKYLDALTPAFQVVDDGSHTNMKWGTAEHRYKLNLNNDGLTKNQLEQIFSETALQTIQKQKLPSPTQPGAAPRSRG